VYQMRRKSYTHDCDWEVQYMRKLITQQTASVEISDRLGHVDLAYFGRSVSKSVVAVAYDVIEVQGIFELGGWGIRSSTQVLRTFRSVLHLQNTPKLIATGITGHSIFWLHTAATVDTQ
jgi:hypothetical protein